MHSPAFQSRCYGMRPDFVTPEREGRFLAARTIGSDVVDGDRLEWIRLASNFKRNMYEGYST